MTNNPLARLRAINVEKQREEEAEANATAEEALLTYSNDAMSTHSNEYVSKGGSEDIQEGGREAASTPSGTSVRKGARARGSTSPSASVKEPAPASAYASIRERVAVPANKQTTTRLNLEMPDELHEWAKMYCLKNKTTLRMLICTLVEDFKQHEDAGE